MTNKEHFKQYIKQYGEMNAIQDISVILQELSTEWKSSNVGDIKNTISYALSSAAFKMADVAFQLQTVDAHWQQQNNAAPDEERKMQNAHQIEFDSHMKFFNSLSTKDTINLYKNNKKEFESRLKRLDFLKKQLQNTKDKAKE